MKRHAAEILKDALALPTEVRAALAGSLLESLATEVDEGAEAGSTLRALRARFAPTRSDVSSTNSRELRTRGRSWGLVIALSILMLLAGAFLGMSITSSAQIQQMSGWMLAAMDSARRSQYAFTQYREADYDEAKDALEQFAVYLESLKPASAEWQPARRR